MKTFESVCVCVDGRGILIHINTHTQTDDVFQVIFEHWPLLPHLQYGGGVKEDLRAQLYLRVFGNEVAYTMLDRSSSSNLERMRGPGGNQYFEEILQRLAKNEQFSFSHSAMFLDSTLVIPTSEWI